MYSESMQVEVSDPDPKGELMAEPSVEPVKPHLDVDWVRLVAEGRCVEDRGISTV